MQSPVGSPMPRKSTANPNRLETPGQDASSALDARPRRQSSLGQDKSHLGQSNLARPSHYTDGHPGSIRENRDLEDRIKEIYNLPITSSRTSSSRRAGYSDEIAPWAFPPLALAGECSVPEDGPDPDRTIALAPLSDPVRRALIERLAEQPCSVGRLASGFPISRAAISQHLKILLDAGLVGYRKRGALNVYSVNPEPLLRLRGYLKDLCLEVEWTSRTRRETAQAFESA